MNVSEGCTVFQYFPWLVCMEMDLDQIFVAYGQKAVTFKVLNDVIKDLIFIKIMSGNQ